MNKHSIKYRAWQKVILDLKALVVQMCRLNLSANYVFQTLIPSDFESD